MSVDGSSEEEVISEKMLGRVLETVDQSDSSTIEKSLKENPAKKVTKAKIKSTSSSAAGIVNQKKVIRRMNTRAAAIKAGEEGGPLEEGLELERRPTPRPKKKDGDQTVIEVKLLTGTLFIYRGENHRVEFVRTV